MDINEQDWLRSMAGQAHQAVPTVDVRQAVLDRLDAGEGRRANRAVLAVFAAVSSAAAVVMALVTIHQLLARAAQIVPLLPGGTLAVTP